MFEMIRSIFRNFTQGPATRMYPVEKRETFPNVRGQVAGIDEEACVYCTLCAKKCPADALVVDRVAKSWTLDPYRCVICGVCAEVCPKKCIAIEGQYRPPVQHKSLHVATKAVPAEVPAAVGAGVE
jgi:ech hydrogenase subunit F